MLLEREKGPFPVPQALQYFVFSNFWLAPHSLNKTPSLRQGPWSLRSEFLNFSPNVAPSCYLHHRWLLVSFRGLSPSIDMIFICVP